MMWIIVNVVIIGIIFLVLFLLWQTGRFHRPAQLPSQPAQPSQGSRWAWWASNWQKLVTGLLLIGLISLVFMRFFPNQIKDLLKDSLTVVVLILATLILFIGGKQKGASRIAVLIIMIIIGITVYPTVYPPIKKQIEEWKKFHPSPAQQEVEELKFNFNAGEKILTVSVGPGDYVSLWGNKPFLVLSTRLDGTKKEYPAPAGWSRWRGLAPTELLPLKGLENDTVVKLNKIRR